MTASVSVLPRNASNLHVNHFLGGLLLGIYTNNWGSFSGSNTI
jgi:hypothetical protein